MDEIRLEGIRSDFFREIDQQNSSSPSFMDILQDSYQQVVNMHQEANVEIKKIATGEIQDIHSLILATEKAEIVSQLLMQVSNKLLNAYDEMMRIQI